MTESDAIKQLKNILSECTESEEAVCYITDVDAPALEMAINALEKQIPKKPKTDDRYVMHICQCCNDFVKVSHNYCQNCGQKLDWGDEEYGKNES